MIPGISPIITTKSGGSAITGTITVGKATGFYAGSLFGYMNAASATMYGSSAFGSISGDAAAFIDGVFAWIPPASDGGARAKNTTKAKLIFQGMTYEYQAGASPGWEFGPEVSTWPTSGTHTFEIIDP